LLSWLRETYGETGWSGEAKVGPLVQIADRMRSGGYLASVVIKALEPTHVSVWISQLR
jgi:hypothetical protein